MHMRHYAVAIAAAAAMLCTVVTPAAAQQERAATTSAARPLATYAFNIARRPVGFPSQVVVSDSAGSLVAHAQIRGETTPRPMTVTVIGADLVLQGWTPRGMLTLVLDGQNQGGEIQVARGRWTLDDEEGTLRGNLRG